MTHSGSNATTLLYETEALQEAFAAIAHQWRQPLSYINALVGSIDNRLYENGIDDPFIAKQLLEIEKMTKEMSKSIDNYRGYFHTKNEKNNLKILFDAMKEESIEYLLKEHAIDFDLQVDESLDFVGDTALFKEIIITLVNNAKDALVSRNIYKPFIKVSVWSENSYLFMKICDNAGGMSRSVMQKIFEPDFTTKHHSEGTGLGLFMVKKLLDEKFNAEIIVKNVESGVCFTLTFPRKENG